MFARYRVALVVMVAFALSCTETTGPETEQSSTLNGSVIRDDNFTGVPNVIVYDINNGSRSDTTSSTGTFSIPYDISTPYSSSIVATRAGFGNDTVGFTLTPGRDTAITMLLSADSSSPSTGSYSGNGASIYLVSASDLVISIRGTGGNETATMIFEVRDSLGIPVSSSNSTTVFFSLDGGPGDGEYIFPASAVTDPLSGRVVTRVTSGLSAGVVQVFATAIIDTVQIKSRPVRLLIAGGFPVQNGISMAVQKFNMPATFNNVTNVITVSAADKDGNPVSNAAFHFGTNGGRIDIGGLTDVAGNVSATLRTGGLTPPANGIVTVTATTVDSTGSQLSRSVPIVFSGPTIISAPTATIVMPDSGGYGFSYTVSDLAGNPLTENTNIAVTVAGDGAGDLVVAGDRTVQIPDTQSPVYTSFNAVVRDTRIGGSSGAFNVIISVESENGNASHMIPGILLSSGSSVYIPANLREPSQIEATAPSRDALDVAGVGGQETSVLSFTVKDSAGVPFDASKRIFVDFNLEFIPNSFVVGGTAPLILPPSDSTDNGGKVRVTLVSGTQAGVAQVVARVMTSLGAIIEARSRQIIIRAGDPNQSHFSFFTDSYAFATTPGSIGPNFFVQLADTFSNPVTGRRIYFHSWAGNVQAEATSDFNGGASVSFLGGNPQPNAAGTAAAGRPTYFGNEGLFWVVSQTTGKAGSTVSDSLLICWSSGPISIAGIPATTLDVPSSGSSVPVDLVIDGSYGNPLPVGTSINISIDFTTNVSGIKFTTTGDLTAGTPYVIPNAAYIVSGGAGVTDFSFRVVDLSQTGAPTGQLMNVIITVNAPNIGSVTRSFNAVVL